MHPSEIGPFRKTILALLTLAFGGGLLAFTAQANLNLLISIYPDPNFIIFGILALEGGVAYWTGYYLLNPSGAHRGFAVFALGVDAIISGVGFFMEMERVTHAEGTVKLPTVILVVAFAVVFNVGMSLASHLIPISRRNPGGDWHNGGGQPTPGPKEPDRYYIPASLEQTGELVAVGSPRRPGLLKNLAANVIAGAGDTMELARERREQLRQARQNPPQVQPAAAELPPTQVQEEKEPIPELKKV